MTLSLQAKAILGGAAVVLGIAGYSAWKTHQIKAADAAIVELEAEGNRLRGVLAEQVKRISVLSEKERTQEVQVADLRKKIAALPKPVPPTPVPAAPEEQIHYFQSYHLNPMVVPGQVGALAFTPQDIPIIGTSLQDSANLPRVSEQLRNTELLVTELGRLGSLKDEHISEDGKVIATVQDSLKVQIAVSSTLKSQLERERAKGKATKILWGITGVAAGFLIHR